MRIGVLGCFHETNTFAPGFTDLSGFSQDWHDNKESFLSAYQETRTSMGGVIDACKQNGVELIPIFYTQAVPSSMVTREAFTQIENTMLQKLNEHVMDIDGLVVILHGAMVSENCEDVEGRLLRHIRQRVASMPIAATIDLHANVTEEMAEHGDFIVGYDTYPHIDAYERAMEAVELLIRCIKGEIEPVRCLGRSDVLIAPTLMNTNILPMKQLMERAFAMEQDPEVLNVSITGGFAFSDVPFAGFNVIVTCDRNREKAKQYADELVSWIIEHKEEFKPKLHSVSEACETIASKKQYPAVLIESSDNVGGGSPADATHVLRYLYEHQIPKYLIVIADEEAVRHAAKTGIGGKFEGWVGGKTDRKYNQEPLHGEPVLIEGRVRLLSDGKYTHRGPYMAGMKAEMGLTAVIELNHGAVLILTEKRNAPWDINHVRSVGIQPEEFEMIVVKAAVAWRSAFGELAKLAIELDTPGCCSSNLAHFQYQRLPESTIRI